MTAGHFGLEDEISSTSPAPPITSQRESKINSLHRKQVCVCVCVPYVTRIIVSKKEQIYLPCTFKYASATTGAIFVFHTKHWILKVDMVLPSGALSAYIVIIDSFMQSSL